MPLATHAHWTAYVGAFAAIVGIVIALVALIIAKRSESQAAASSESAGQTRDAAEAIATASESTLGAATEQLSLARTEHEYIEADRARRPVVSRLDVSEIRPLGGQEAPAGVFCVGFKNSGDRDLVDAVLTILIDPGCLPELTDRWGTTSGHGPDDETTERWPGTEGLPRGFEYFTHPVRLSAGVSGVQYVRLKKRGRFALRIKLFHAHLVGGGPWIDARIEVDGAGTARVEDLTRRSTEGASFEGRCEAFEAATDS